MPSVILRHSVPIKTKEREKVGSHHSATIVMNGVIPHGSAHTLAKKESQEKAKEKEKA